ncbi:hypothetical protein [Longispora albida]|uniref:hypothetical protein n=1 Tax=Longispora albida TaxID=203523 RepID=UPI00036EB5D7|nr:hypothetical protein [Longispora albida]
MRARITAAVLVMAASAASACSSGDEQRPLNTAEAERLATVRLGNHTDKESGFTAKLTDTGRSVSLRGWIDWRQSLVYGRLEGGASGLVQSRPGVVATRAGQFDKAPFPPPAGDWNVRPARTGGRMALDTVLAVLFELSADRPENLQLLQQNGAAWLREDKVGGVDVDVFLGPRTAGPGGQTRAPGEGLRYWVDDGGRLRRLEARAAGEPVTIDFDRGDRPALTAVPVLGGKPVTPRAVTDAEAAALAGIRLRAQQQRGATLAVTMPASDVTTLSATGWVNWPAALAQLSVTQPAPALMRATPSGAMVLNGTHDPLHPPASGWVSSSWESRADPKLGPGELDVLLRRLLALSSAQADDPAAMKAGAAWLRSDTVDGQPAAVFEIPEPDEAKAQPGDARFRYWIGPAGDLRRLELRTRAGAMAILDLTPGQIPQAGS